MILKLCFVLQYKCNMIIRKRFIIKLTTAEIVKCCFYQHNNFYDSGIVIILPDVLWYLTLALHCTCNVHIEIRYYLIWNNILFQINYCYKIFILLFKYLYHFLSHHESLWNLIALIWIANSYLLFIHITCSGLGFCYFVKSNVYQKL
jgi:hypothetical protein